MAVALLTHPQRFARGRQARIQAHAGTNQRKPDHFVPEYMAISDATGRFYEEEASQYILIELCR
jgi:hypothetical protein